MERCLEQEKQTSQIRLHEATASARESVHKQMLELQSEVKRAAAASSSKNQQLALELADAKQQVLNMQNEKKAFFEQQMKNEMEKAARKTRLRRQTNL